MLVEEFDRSCNVASHEVVKVYKVSSTRELKVEINTSQGE